MTISAKTSQFLQQNSQSTLKETEIAALLEQEFDIDDSIATELALELNDLRVPIEEDIQSSFKDFQKQISDIHQIYSRFVSKYDLSKLTSVAIECLNKKVPWLNVQSEICLAAVREFLKTTDINEAMQFLQLLDGTIESVKTFAVNILPLKSKKPPISSELDTILNELQKTFDIQQICDVFSLQIPNFSQFFKIPDIFQQRLDSFKSKLPEFPTFEFPDNLETVDFLQNVQELTEKQIREQVLQFVVSTVSVILQQVIQNNCQDDNSSTSIQSLADLSAISNQIKSKYGSNSDDLANLAETVSAVLSASELCGLLRGNSNSEINQIIQFLIEKKFPSLKNVLNDEESIRDFFVLLSNAVDLGICEQVLQSGGEFGPCLNREVGELRECLLRRQDIEKIEIDAFLSKIKKDHQETLQKLFKILSDAKDESFDFSRICEVDLETQLFQNISQDFETTSQSIIDGVLKTVGISYDQAIQSYVSKLLKTVEVPTAKITENLPNLANSVVNTAKKTYNDLFSNALGGFQNQQNELQNIIQQSTNGNNAINDYIALSNANQYTKAESFLSSQQKRVQPDLKNRLQDGSFLASVNGNLVFNLPKREISEANKLFEDKMFSSVLPVDTQETFSVKLYGEIDNEGNIFDHTEAKHSYVEKRLKRSNFEVQSNTSDCQVVKVYLPICFGLATYDKLYDSVEDSQPLFPNYPAIWEKYFPQYQPMPININLDIVGLKNQAATIFLNMAQSIGQNLKQKTPTRLFSHGLSRLSTSKTHALNLGTKISEKELFLRFWDVFNIRLGLNDDFVTQMQFWTERHWLEKVWPKLNVAYYYRVYKTGEAFLVKIDLNEQIQTSVDDSEYYGGPKVNIEDILSYNTVKIDQPNWKNWILDGDFSIIHQNLKNFSPLRPSSLLRNPNLDENESRYENSRFRKGLIEYEFGIPANEKARQSSWNTKDGMETERFGQQNSLLPSYLGDFVRMSDNVLQKSTSYQSSTDKINVLNSKSPYFSKLMNNFNPQNEIPVVGFNPKTGKPIIYQSAIPTSNQVNEKYRISNILDIGGNALQTLQNQLLKVNIANATNANEYSYNQSTESFSETKKVTNQNATKFFIGSNKNSNKIEENKGNWKQSDQTNVEETKLETPTIQNSSKDNIWATSWANIVIQSIQNELNLTETDKKSIREFYQKDGYSEVFSDIIKKLSRFVSTSPIFQSIETTEQQPQKFTVDDRDGLPKEGLLETNILELVNFNPKFSADLVCSIDVDLMRLSEIRREIVQKQKQLVMCLQDDNLNKVVLFGIVKILLRLYAVEVILGSVFFFSRFNLAYFEIENMVANMVANRILKELPNQTFKTDFLEIVASIWLEEFKSTDNQVDCLIALEQLVKNQIKMVSARLKNVLYTPQSQQQQVFEVEEVFKQLMTPFVSLPSKDLTYSQGRFVPTNLENMTDLQVEDYLRGFVGLQEIQNRAKRYEIGLSGFFLEKYVIPVWKEKYRPYEKSLSGIVGVEQFNNFLETKVEDRGDRLTKYLDSLKVGMRLSYRPKKDSKEHNFLKTFINRKFKQPNFETKTFYEPGIITSISPFYYIRQVIEGTRTFPTIKQRIRLELYWKVQTKKERQQIVQMLKGQQWDFSKLTAQNPRKTKIHVSIDNKTLLSFEEFNKNGDYRDVLDFIEGDLYTGTDDAGLLSNFRLGSLSQPTELPVEFKTNANIGESILIPIKSIENDIDVSTLIENLSSQAKNIVQLQQQKQDVECKNIRIQNEKQVSKIQLEFDLEYDRCFEQKFKDILFFSDEWKLIVQRIFPLSKISNILMLYILYYNRTTTDVLTMFNGVKNNLFSFLDNLKNLDDPRYTDSTFFSTPNNPSNITLDSPFFDLNSIRNSTPFIILKGLMETFDPNIAPAKKVVDIANNYKQSIIKSAEPLIRLAEKDKRTTDEESELFAAQSLIDLAKELEQTPDLPIHIPSIFFMIAGIVPSPLGFAYLGFESILGTDLLDKVQNNLQLKRKIELETGVSLDSAREFARILSDACNNDSKALSS